MKTQIDFNLSFFYLQPGNPPNPLSGDKLSSDCDKVDKVQEGEKGDHETGGEDQEEKKEGEVENK